MSYRINAHVDSVLTPPIADVQGWVSGREFPPDKPLLDVSQAVPSYAPAASLVERVGEAATAGETATYGPILGLERLREALARHLSDDYESEIAPDRVAITAGCNQAFCVAMSALAEPGDEVILPLPYYFNHQMWLQMQGIRPVYLPFDAHAGGTPSVEQVAAALTPRTRALALVSPNNPTGCVYPPELIEAMFELAHDRGFALVVDETYKDFRTERDRPAHCVFRDLRWPEAFVHLYSFSKAYSLTGYRVGAIVCGAPLIGAVEKILDCVTICAPCISQEAALHALEHLDAWRDEKSRMMSRRVEALREQFRRNELEFDLLSCGAYFAYVRHPFRGESAREVARRLVDRENVLCIPGSMFGLDQDDYLRFAFANLDAAEFPDLVQRLIDFRR